MSQHAESLIDTIWALSPRDLVSVDVGRRLLAGKPPLAYAGAMITRRLLIACTLIVLASALTAGTEILSDNWDPDLSVIVVRLDAFPP